MSSLNQWALQTGTARLSRRSCSVTLRRKLCKTPVVNTKTEIEQPQQSLHTLICLLSAISPSAPTAKKARMSTGTTAKTPLDGGSASKPKTATKKPATPASAATIKKRKIAELEKDVRKLLLKSIHFCQRIRWIPCQITDSRHHERLTFIPLLNLLRSLIWNSILTRCAKTRLNCSAP